MFLRGPIKDLTYVFIVPFVVLIIHLIATYVFHAYDLWASFDIPMHFTGGLSIGILADRCLQVFQRRDMMSAKHWLPRLLLVIAVVALAAGLWEILEFIGDNTLYNHPHFQTSVGDTVGDLALGLLGGLVTFIFSFKIEKAKE
jgi:hypothetical protein